MGSLIELPTTTTLFTFSHKMKYLLIALILAFASTTADAQPAKPPPTVKKAPASKVKPKVKKPVKVKKATPKKPANSATQ